MKEHRRFHLNMSPMGILFVLFLLCFICNAWPANERAATGKNSDNPDLNISEIPCLSQQPLPLKPLSIPLQDPKLNPPVKSTKNPVQKTKEEAFEEDEIDPIPEGLLQYPDLINLVRQPLAGTECVSLGAPSRGRLFNGIQLTSGIGITVRSEEYSFGTPETIAAIRFAVNKVNQQFPGSPDLIVGDISNEGGGKLKRHRSHQSGRDADLGYFLKKVDQTAGFVNATASNLDVKRTWALIESLLEGNKTEYIFIDRSIQRILYYYVKYKLQAPPSYLHTVFSYPSYDSQNHFIQHLRNHKNHIHVRFISPMAIAAAEQYIPETKQIARISSYAVPPKERPEYISLDKLEKVDYGPMPHIKIIRKWQTTKVSYRVRRGDTVASVARRNGVRITSLMKWNAMSGKPALHPGQVLTIQKAQLTEKEVNLGFFDGDIPFEEVNRVARSKSANLTHKKISPHSKTDIRVQ